MNTSEANVITEEPGDDDFLYEVWWSDPVSLRSRWALRRAKTAHGVAPLNASDWVARRVDGAWFGSGRVPEPCDWEVWLSGATCFIVEARSPAEAAGALLRGGCPLDLRPWAAFRRSDGERFSSPCESGLPGSMRGEATLPPYTDAAKATGRWLELRTYLVQSIEFAAPTFERAENAEAAAALVVADAMNRRVSAVTAGRADFDLRKTKWSATRVEDGRVFGTTLPSPPERRPVAALATRWCDTDLAAEDGRVYDVRIYYTNIGIEHAPLVRLKALSAFEAVRRVASALAMPFEPHNHKWWATRHSDGAVFGSVPAHPDDVAPEPPRAAMQPLRADPGSSTGLRFTDEPQRHYTVWLFVENGKVERVVTASTAADAARATASWARIAAFDVTRHQWRARCHETATDFGTA